jgi:hypothetical protein
VKAQIEEAGKLRLYRDVVFLAIHPFQGWIPKPLDLQGWKPCTAYQYPTSLERKSPTTWHLTVAFVDSLSEWLRSANSGGRAVTALRLPCAHSSQAQTRTADAHCRDGHGHGCFDALKVDF